MSKQRNNSKGSDVKSVNADGATSEPLLEIDNALRRLGGDENLFVEFITIFTEDSPDLMDGIKLAIENGDASALTMKAHALKGLASNFGAKAYVDLAADLEKDGRSGEMEKCDKKFDQLTGLYEELHAELKAYRRA